MTNRHIIFVPGKNPKPPAEQHRGLLWRTLLEGVRRAEPTVAGEFGRHAEAFSLVAWNHLYYRKTKDVSRDLPWIDALINTHGPSTQDIREAEAWPTALNRALFSVVDLLPIFLRLLPKPMRMTARETRRYFENRGGIASGIRELLKGVLRPLLTAGEPVLLIGHSLGSVIAYDTLWELSHLEPLPGKVEQFLTLGSPLGMHYVQRRLLGAEHHGRRRYPTNIRRWVNVSAVGDLTALDRVFCDDYREMLDLGLVEAIEDHAKGIYNFFRNEQGLNCHRSYGYLVNPAVGKIIADWWVATT